MGKSDIQEKLLFRLWEDWRALIKLLGNEEPGTPLRQALDQRYNQVLPLVAMITDLRFSKQVPELAAVALRILENKKE